MNYIVNLLYIIYYIMDNSIGSENQNRKQIKVLVPVGDFPLAKKITYANGNIEYKGLFYDIWAIIKQNLQHKYIFEETYIIIDNVDKIVNQIKEGEYDICIAPFTPTYNRLNMVSFTKAIVLDSPSILHIRRISHIGFFYELIKSVFFKSLIIIIILSILIVIAFYYIDVYNFSKRKKNIYFGKLFLSVIATFFHEHSIVEKTNIKIKSIFIVITFFIITTFVTMYIQGMVTTKLIQMNTEGSFNRKNIIGQSFVAQKGYEDAKQIENWGGKVIYLEDTTENIFNKYLHNNTKNEGIILDRSEAQSLLDKYKYKTPDLIISYTDFGFIDHCFIINKQHKPLHHDIDLQILDIKKIGGIEKLCKVYLDPSLINLCVS